MLLKHTLCTKIEIILPLGFLLATTLILTYSNLDLAISELFYRDQEGWFLQNHFLIKFGNQFGPLLSGLFILVPLVLLIRSFVNSKFVDHRVKSYYVLLCFLLGPLLLINGFSKETWKRPRPRDVIEFNGSHQFIKILNIGKEDFQGNSFPSGHAAGGFVLSLFYFLYKRKSFKKAVEVLTFSLLFGIWMAATRIISGGHFLSDTIWSFGICWFVNLFLYYKFYLPLSKKSTKTFPESNIRYAFLGGGMLIFGLLIAYFLYSVKLVRRNLDPIVKTLPKRINKLSINAVVEKGDIYKFYTDDNFILIESRIKGYGMKNLTIVRKVKFKETNNELFIELSTMPDGFHLSYHSYLYIKVPKGMDVSWNLTSKNGRIKIRQN